MPLNDRINALATRIGAELKLKAPRDALNVAVYGGTARTTTPYAKMFSNVAQNNIFGSAVTTVTLTSVAETTDAAMCDVPNNQIVIQLAGVYLVIAQMNWASNATGQRQLRLLRDTTAVEGQVVPGTTAPNGTPMSLTALVRCTVGQVLLMQAWQNATAASPSFLATAVALSGTQLTARWVGP